MDLKPLLAELKKTYPERVWKKGITIEELACSRGEQRVIEYLDKLAASQIGRIQ